MYINVLVKKRFFFFQFSVYSGQRRNTFVLIGGKQSPKTDVADFANPTYSCQHQIADFPNPTSWQAGGGWVDGVLIACSVNPDNKCYSLSVDGKFTIFNFFVNSTLDLHYLSLFGTIIGDPETFYESSKGILWESF